MLSLAFGLLAICVSVIFCYFTVEYTAYIIMSS